MIPYAPGAIFCATPRSLLTRWIRRWTRSAAGRTTPCLWRRTRHITPAKASAYASELEAAAENINSAVFTLTDAAETLRDFRDSLDFSPEEYNELETRIALLNKLQRKYSRDEDALISYLDECREKLDGIQYAEERSAKLRRELDAAAKDCAAKRRRPQREAPRGRIRA